MRSRLALGILVFALGLCLLAVFVEEVGFLVFAAGPALLVALGGLPDLLRAPKARRATRPSLLPRAPPSASA